MRPFFSSSLAEPPRALASLLCLLILQCCHVSLHYAWSHPFNCAGEMWARLSSAQLVCSSPASPSALPHRPVALSLSHLRQGVKGWQAEVSWHTSFSADKYLSTGWEKHKCTFLSLEPITPVFFFFFFCSFLAPVEMRRWTQLFLPLQLLARAWRTRQSQLYNFPTSITTCVSVNGATRGTASDWRARCYILRAGAAMGAITWSQWASRYSEGTNSKVQGSGFSAQCNEFLNMLELHGRGSELGCSVWTDRTHRMMERSSCCCG